MKRGCAILLVLVMLMSLLSACTKDETPPDQVSGVTATPRPTPTVPNYADADFTGKWTVSALYDSSGAALTAEQIAQAGANFTLELLDGGIYFLYDAQGAPIGQGQYTAAQQELTLSANGAQTVYEIQDIDTLRCKAEDGSVTVMTRLAEPGEEDIGEPSEQSGAEETDTEEPDTEETDMDEPIG
jgi:hypothetical protein